MAATEICQKAFNFHCQILTRRPVKRSKVYINSLFTACTCDIRGAKNGDKCAHKSDGTCLCKEGTKGKECNECEAGFWGFGQNPDIGCNSKFNSITI